MTQFASFSYRDESAFRDDLGRYAPALPYADDLSPLAEPFQLGGAVLANRLAIHPMEGADGTAEGSPDTLTFRRYERFASGGAALLWFEATAVTPEGRANPRQLYIHPGNVGVFRDLLARSRAAAAEKGRNFYAVLQLTHSGRQSRPGDAPAPVIAEENPVLDRQPGRIITDAELDELRGKFVTAAELAAEAGFDAVDLKACHGYLLGELLAARKRPGKYGGPFENRVRFMLETADAIRTRLGGAAAAASRFGVWDSIPGGWGIDQDDYRRADFSEPVRLARMLAERGVTLLDITCGNPYFNPHVNRPFDRGFYTPPEHPMQGAEKLLLAAKAVQEAVPEAAVAATGLSWFRQYGANIAAGLVRDGWASLAGFGRQAFAYPDFAEDILEHGGLAAGKCCVACGNCTQIMRDGGRSGCMVRDREVYLPIFREGREGKPPADMSRTAEHL